MKEAPHADQPTISEVSTLDTEDDEQYLEWVWTAQVVQALCQGAYHLQANEVVVHQYQTDVESGETKYAGSVIERELNILSKAEEQAHWNELQAARLKEIKRWTGRSVFARMRKRIATNIVISRWVLKCKMIDGKREIKARLCVHGCKRTNRRAP